MPEGKGWRMVDDRELICLISIGSSLFNPDLIREFDGWAADHRMRIRYAILGNPERHNIRVFQSVGEETAQSIAVEHSIACQEKLGLPDANLIGWDEICTRTRYNSVLERILSQFQKDRSFKAHCLSQTFSNLRPRFREIGVRNKADARVGLSVFYLLEELAIKIGAFEYGEFYGEILPREEMDIVKEIYAGTYFACNVSKKGFRVICLSKSGHSQIDYDSRNTAP
jgi:tRNA-dependent cyclodipeptide synthase